ncbi:hypothetical protein M23134_02109 [Microscilla marina ATCC 23134]|uniref:Uncharacterized protein n=1 Tax=Microscilla marina ATCC 23134 TaxID=313606 RepID=A1ZCS8_MICM2|nr:hypothetical protein M23134_02109 [Microscilla marina ATCC 23134]
MGAGLFFFPTTGFVGFAAKHLPQVLSNFSLPRNKVMGGNF